MSPRATRYLKALGTVLSLLTIVAFAGYLAVYCIYAGDLFRWPFDYDQGEGFELNDAILFSRGEWPYRDNAVYPYYASNYPPLFHLLIVPLLPLFGPRLVAGRIVSFLATLVTAATIALIVRRKARGWLIPSISGLAFLASNYVYQIGPLCRLHMTMVMFEAIAIAFIGEFEDREHGRRNLVLGLVMILLAGYTKQMAVFCTAAALGYVFLRDIRKALVAGGCLVVAAGLIFWLLNAATDGQWWINTIQANVNEFDYRQTLFLLGQWFRLHPVLVVLAGGYVLFELFWDRLSAYSLWFLFALGLGLLSGKWGAGFGYFASSIAAACVASGLALGRLQDAAARERRQVSVKPIAASPQSLGQAWPSTAARRVRAFVHRRAAWAPPLLTVALPALYLLQASFLLHLPTSGPVFGPLARALGVADRLVQGDCTTFAYHDAMGYTQLGHLLTTADYEAGRQILDYALTADGPVFSEEAMFSLLAGEPVVTNPTQLLNLYKNNLLDTSDIVARIEAEEFGVVVFRAQFYPPPVLEAIGQSYQPVDHICMNGFNYHILWPHRTVERLSAAADE
jgi:hypothetical protein